MSNRGTNTLGQGCDRHPDSILCLVPQLSSNENLNAFNFFRTKLIGTHVKLHLHMTPLYAVLLPGLEVINSLATFEKGKKTKLDLRGSDVPYQSTRQWLKCLRIKIEQQGVTIYGVFPCQTPGHTHYLKGEVLVQKHVRFLSCPEGSEAAEQRVRHQAQELPGCVPLGRLLDFADVLV